MSRSRLKKRAEADPAPPVRGRVSVVVTSRHDSHDRDGGWAIRVDGRAVFDACTFGDRPAQHSATQEAAALGATGPGEDAGLGAVRGIADEPLQKRGVFGEQLHPVPTACRSLSIDDTLASAPLA